VLSACTVNIATFVGNKEMNEMNELNKRFLKLAVLSVECRCHVLYTTFSSDVTAVISAVQLLSNRTALSPVDPSPEK